MSDTSQKLQAASQLQQDLMRPARHVNIDGSFELGWGTAILCLSLSGFIYIILPKVSKWTAVIGWLPFLCGMLAPYVIPKLIKKYITWPRAGYVAYRRTKSFWAAIIVSVVVSIGISFGLSYLLTSELRHAPKVSSNDLIRQQWNSDGLIQAGKGSPGYLGARLREVTPELAKEFNLPAQGGGVLVYDVIPESPAEKAGLKKRDVILEASGKKMDDTQTLRRLIAEIPPGTNINVRILRGRSGQSPVEQAITVVIGELPPKAALSTSPPPPSPRPMSLAQKAMLVLCLLLFCAALVAYWKRQTIMKHIPWPPTAKAANIDEQTLQQMMSDGKRMRKKKIFIYLILFGIPVLIGGAIFGLLYLNEFATHPGAISLQRTGFLAVFVASNAILYLMGAGATLKEYPWKWLLFVLLVLGPLGIGLFAPVNSSDLSPLMMLSRPVMLFVGLVWFISGLATLFTFVQRNQPPAQEAE